MKVERNIKFFPSKIYKEYIFTLVKSCLVAIERGYLLRNTILDIIKNDSIY